MFLISQQLTTLPLCHIVTFIVVVVVVLLFWLLLSSADVPHENSYHKYPGVTWSGECDKRLSTRSTGNTRWIVVWGWGEIYFVWGLSYDRECRDVTSSDVGEWPERTRWPWVSGELILSLCFLRTQSLTGLKKTQYRFENSGSFWHKSLTESCLGWKLNKWVDSLGKFVSQQRLRRSE